MPGRRAQAAVLAAALTVALTASVAASRGVDPIGSGGNDRARFQSAAAVAGRVAWASDTTPSTTTTAVPTIAAPPAPLPPPPPPADPPVALMIGDSVMLGGASDLQAMPGWAVVVDGAVSRQWGEPFDANGVDVVRSYRAAGWVGSRVVIHLGTNGPFSDAQFDELMGLLADVPRVVFLTVPIPTYPDVEPQVNAGLAAGVARWPNAVLADWKALSDAHPEYLGADSIHLTSEGRAAYAALIRSHL